MNGRLPGMAEGNTSPILTRKALAKSLGVHEQTIVKWVEDGCPVAKPGSRGVASKYDLAQVVAWRVDTARQANDDDSLSLQHERAALARAQRIKTETENARIARTLIPVDEVRKAGMHFVVAWRAMLLGLPGLLVREGHITPEQQPGVKAAFRRLLQEVARWKVPADLDASVQRMEADGDLPDTSEGKP